MRTAPKAFAVGIAAITLTACANASVTVVDRPMGTLPVHPRWTSCTSDAPLPSPGSGNDALTLPRLLGDFAPRSVIVCDEQDQRRADGGQDLVAAESRSDDVAALVAALRLPDEQRTTAPCTLAWPGVPWFVLLDEHGHWVRPGVPKDSCGKVRIEVRNAIAGLRLARLATHVLREIESAQAAASGCSQGYADMIAMETSHGSSPARAAVGSDPFPPTQRIRLCVYRVPPGEQGTDKPGGDFEHGIVLTPQKWASIDKLLLAAAPAKNCWAPAGRFARLTSADGARGEVYIELDGCERIMVFSALGHPLLAQGDAALVGLLERS